MESLSSYQPLGQYRVSSPPLPPLPLVQSQVAGLTFPHSGVEFEPIAAIAIIVFDVECIIQYIS